MLKTSALTEPITIVAQIMVNYDKVDGSRSGVGSKWIKKLSKSRKIVKSQKILKA